MRFIMRWLLPIMTFNYLALAMAQSSNPAFPTVSTSPNASQSPATPVAITCPDINQLVRNPTTLKWEGKDPHRWKGYEMSFESSIDHFAGAQWHGTTVGQVFCVYQSTIKTSFPILVLFHAEVEEPKGHLWSKNLGEYRNCVSRNLQDCPFVPVPAPPEENPYKELQQMKSGPTQELGY